MSKPKLDQYPTDVPIWWGVEEHSTNDVLSVRHAYPHSYAPGAPVTALCGVDFTHRPFDELTLEQQTAPTCSECDRAAWWIRTRTRHPHYAGKNRTT